MLGILLACYFYPPLRQWLDRLAEINACWSYGDTAIIAGGVIPALLRIGVFQNGHCRRSNLSNLLFAVPFCLRLGRCGFRS